MSTRRFVAAAVQLCAGSNKSENHDKAEAFAAEAARHEARLVVLPEVFLWRGQRTDERAAAEAIPGPSTHRLGDLARRLHIHLIAGSLFEGSGGPKVFNTSVLFDPRGDLVARYRKLHLFDVDIAGRVSIRESDTRVAGDTVASGTAARDTAAHDAVVVAPTELGVIGMSICYDLRFPELYRRLTFAGAEIIAVPSAFTFPTGTAHWEILLRARAIENQVYLIAPDQMGQSPSGVVDFGNSMIVDPWGTPLARAADRETLVLAEIDRDYQERVRRELPCLTHVKLRG